MESNKEFKERIKNNHKLIDFIIYMKGNYSEAYLRYLDMTEEEKIELEQRVDRMEGSKNGL